MTRGPRGLVATLLAVLSATVLGVGGLSVQLDVAQAVEPAASPAAVTLTSHEGRPGPASGTTLVSAPQDEQPATQHSAPPAVLPPPVVVGGWELPLAA
ncbi:hypothetical protein, partial [Actinotalea sp. C106]|uniref:hypothetical protein n=1 Tax=Actinotalea sp. C106 TaxID=2908644 RepID=UPI0020294002